MQPLVSCVLITYNSEKFLPTFFESLVAQTGTSIELIIIDNASRDETLKKIHEWHASGAAVRQVEIIQNTKNLGYSGAAEQGIRAAHGEYILIANPDIVFEPDYIHLLVEKMESDKKIAAISGKLLKYDFKKYFQSSHHDVKTKVADGKTNIIDSAGLVMYKNRRCVDRGQGAEDRGQFDEAQEVFGVTGAAPLYRKSALLDAEIGEHVFDPDFFMYKEDVDIAWRLRLVGYSCFYLPKAVAYHGRGTSVLERESLTDVAKNRKFLPRFTRQHSYRNERVMRLRNEFTSHVVSDFFKIAWRELLMIGWIAVREPSLIKSLFQFAARVPKELKKRAQFKRKIKITAKEMHRWFV